MTIKGLTTVALLAMSIALASACAKARAQVVPDGPALAVPSAPPRVIVPPAEPAVAVVAPVETPPTGTATAPVPPTARPTPSGPAAAAAPAGTGSPASVEAARPSPLTTAEMAEERRIREILRRAARDIGRVTPSRLTAARRSQYEQSRSLAEQAEQALEDRNWVFADTLADKAATLAAELVGR